MEVLQKGGKVEHVPRYQNGVEMWPRSFEQTLRILGLTLAEIVVWNGEHSMKKGGYAAACRGHQLGIFGRRQGFAQEPRQSLVFSGSGWPTCRDSRAVEPIAGIKSTKFGCLGALVKR